MNIDNVTAYWVSVEDYEHDEDSPILYEIKKSGIEIKLKPSGRKLAKL